MKKNHPVSILPSIKTEALARVEAAVRERAAAHGADRLLVLTDSNVARLLPDGFLADAPRMTVEAGEESKSVEGAVSVWHFLKENGALRRSVLVNVGGGMVSDLGGFAAATFKRGIGCINVPTTLLAAVDAAIGGKTGINFEGLKNEVGAFALPLGVFPLTALFDTLPTDEWLSGAGEAIKTGLLDSEDLYRLAVSEAFIIDRDPAVVEEVVARCAAYKEGIVKRDFREGGLRRILNLGHTFGHAIESWKMAAGRPMPHGVAVAHGIAAALRKSVKEAGLPLAVAEDYEKILNRYFPALDMTPAQLAEAAEYMRHDKKNTIAGEPSWVLLKAIGTPSF